MFAALRGHRPSTLEWAGLSIGFLGVLWLSAGGSLAGTPMGLAALLLASLAWSYGSIWSKGRDLPSPFMTSAGQMPVSYTHLDVYKRQRLCAWM